MKRLNQLATGTIIGSFILSLLIDWIKSDPFLSTLKAVIKWLYNLLISFFTYPVKVWAILVIALVLLIVYGILKSISENATPIEPDFFKYKSDIFKLWLWKWDYKTSYEDGKWVWDIINLTPYCPNDGVRLVKNFTGYGNYGLKCPKCNSIYATSNDTIEQPIDIKALILHKIETNTYPKP